MTELAIAPWGVVNANMTDEYRDVVAEIALERLPQAGDQLKYFAARALSKVAIPGFRSLSHVPESIAKRYIVKEMLTNNLVTTAVICLWADAKMDELVTKLARIAENYGWQIRSDWSWEKAREGFYTSDDMRIVATLFDKISEEYEGLEKNDLLLATLWLSRGFVQQSDEDFIEGKCAPVMFPLESGMDDMGQEDDSTSFCLKLDTEDVEYTVIDEVIGQTLEVLIENLRFSFDSLTKVKQSVIVRVRSFLSNLEDGLLVEAQGQIENLSSDIKSWRSQRQKLRAKTKEATFIIIQELDARLDLDPDCMLREKIHEISKSEDLLVESINEVFRAAEQIFSYDERKDGILAELDHTQAEIIVLLSDLAVWVESTTSYEEQLVESEALADVTLEAAQVHLDTARTCLQGLKKQLAHFKESSCNHIVAMAKNLKENFKDQDDYELIPGFHLSEIGIERVIDLAPEYLSNLERALEDSINQQMMEMENHCSTALAAELLQHWTSERLEALLQAMVDENRDAEVVLLLLASIASHPSSESLLLSDEVVDSFLRGLDLFSGDSNPSQLFNLGVSTLLRGWKPKELLSKAKLCLHLIAAKYAGKYHLPSDFLWEVTTAWPFSCMTGWAKLWEQSLLESELPLIVDEQQDNGLNILEQAKSQCQQMFVREGGSFVRLRSIKSRRHQAMICDYFLPDFEDIWKRLQDLESKLEHSSGVDEIAHWVAQIKSVVSDRMGENLDDDALIGLYDHAIYKAEIQERQPFHRRITLRVLREYVQSLTEYSQVLMRYWKPRAQQETVFSRGALLGELSSRRELIPIGQAVIAELTRCNKDEKPEWVGMQAEQTLHRHFLSTLLSQTSYAWRLPHVIGYLVANQIAWANMLPPLLEDLAQPAEILQSAHILLEQHAPNQALLLVQHIPFEFHDEIQNQRVKEEKRFLKLRDDLLKLGGEDEDLDESRRLGRWPLLVRIMEERLYSCQAEAEKKSSEVQKQARELLSAINEVEMEIFEIRNLMPSEAYDLIGQGLNLARSIVRQSILFQEIRNYLSEVWYRLEHESWSSTDLQQMLDHLRDIASGKTQQVVERNSKIVLHCLEQEDRRALGLGPTDISPSEIATRTELLQNWLAVRDLSFFLSQDLMRSQREKVHKLFSAFAQMTAMARHRTHTGNPMTFEEPIIHEYWELKYPKASVLERDCIFVVLPGVPPSPQYFKELDNIIQDREWLTYGFVFLFAPGLTEKLHNRLQQSYQNRGLVIIDEQAMLTMILAESETRTPLGRLRAMMLNAYGAQSVDVFKVNQSVDPRMGIFVGRDYLVRKISSSGDNYALYGGRRIGKSSILGVVESLLKSRDRIVVSDSLEGRNCSDDAIARTLAEKLPFEVEVETIEDFRTVLQQYLDSHSDAHIVFLLDEIDPYIRANSNRHVFIETLRALAERYGNRFRVIVAGFMYLYNCLKGEGPYTPSSDPWRRMFNSIRLDNLSAISAEKIVKEGFLDVLGWDFESRAVAQWIVERTSGHPAFVQYYCMKLKDLVAKRGDRCVRLQDILDVFAAESPDDSFISHVRSTLAMNLDSIEGAIGRYVILWLATESKEKQGFTFSQAQEIASLSGVEIPEDYLQRALERLKVTSVVVERSPGVFDFSVPDYPLILNRLGDTEHLEELESKLKDRFGG